MREVINYKPDIFTRRLCIFAWASRARLSIQFFFSCLLCGLSSSLTFSFWSWLQPAVRSTKMQCPSAKVALRLFLWHKLWLFFVKSVLAYSCFMQRRSVRSICLVPEAKMIRWGCKCTTAHSKQLHQGLSGFFYWPLFKTLNKVSRISSVLPTFMSMIYWMSEYILLHVSVTIINTDLKSQCSLSMKDDGNANHWCSVAVAHYKNAPPFFSQEMENSLNKSLVWFKFIHHHSN